MTHRLRNLTLTLALLLAIPAWAADGNFVKAGQIDLLALLPPPPAGDSAQTRHEIDELLALQKSRTPNQETEAQADNTEIVFRFANVVGPDFTPEKLPITAAFFAKILKDEGVVVDPAKDTWKRVRPYLIDPTLKPDVPAPKSASYPSGHTTFGTLSGIILANMIPEKRAAIMTRAWDYGHNRMVGGVHYPSDVEAGRIAATVIADEMMKDAEFQAEFAKARAELRAALKLP